VAANGWIEGTTVSSIILGTVLGGALISPHRGARDRAHACVDRHAGRSRDGDDHDDLRVAALFNLRIPDTGARYPKQERGPVKLITDFADCFMVLWRDKLGQISLAVTTLFWGAGATLQFIVLKWAEVSLNMSLSQGAILQAVVASASRARSPLPRGSR
jgi:hypothetical protein